MRSRLAGLTFLAAAWAGAAGALAHPHVWIDMTSAVGFTSKGEIAALGVAWTFDEFYSMAAVDGLDTNKDGQYDAKELKELGDTYLKNLQRYNYFMALEGNGKALATKPAEAGVARFEKGRLIFSFRLPLAAAVDPRAVKFAYSSFDPTYYISIQPAKVGGVRFSAGAPKDCGFKTREASGPAPAMGFNLSQTLQTPEPPDGIFGALPAPIVEIRCGAGTAM
jgi:ABC-type uncharacterized transport system substrate-binding protein